MTTAIQAFGVITAGRLSILDPALFTKDLRRMKDGDVLVRIERAHATRSVQQNRWYWGVLVEALVDHTGHSADEIHEILKSKFLPKALAVQDKNGVIVGEYVIGGTTTRLTKRQFAEYCDRVRLWALEELGIAVPDPDSPTVH